MRRGWARVALLAAVAMTTVTVAPATPALAASESVTVDFESLTGPSVFGPADAPVVLGGMAISGGKILTATTNLPANQTTVYGTADFCSGCDRALLAEFAKPVDELAFDLLNGLIVDVEYSVITDYGTETHTLRPNWDSGMVRVAIPHKNVWYVRVTPRYETPEWDFFVDNFTFKPRGGGSFFEPYETYKWEGLDPLESAEKAMKLTLSRFITEADSSFHDTRLNWEPTDPVCSVWGFVAFFEDEFEDACRRHDFGYGNFGQDMALDPTNERRAEIDLIFLADMKSLCRREVSRLERAFCMAEAQNFYNFVHLFGGLHF